MRSTSGLRRAAGKATESRVIDVEAVDVEVLDTVRLLGVLLAVHVVQRAPRHSAINKALTVRRQVGFRSKKDFWSSSAMLTSLLRCSSVNGA